MDKLKKIIIADDHEIFRLGLKVAIEKSPDWNVVGEAESGEELLEIIKKEYCDIIIVDFVLPGMNGIQTILKTKEQHPNLKSIIISSSRDPRLLTMSKEYGINGYIFKTEVRNTILTAIQSVLAGDSYYSNVDEVPVVPNKKPDAANPFRNLSPKELEILKLTVKGYSQKETSEKLNISIRTVETHRRNISEKVGKLPTPKLVRLAYIWNVVQDDELVSIHKSE
ncbi:MAG: response regulator transcription factor [Leptospiraceae bacterium]|nr:response regulator transcription factor [Leptospiraceae bacterium]